MSTLVGCGIDPEETAATLGEEQISLGLVNFMAKYQKAGADDLYVGYFGTDVWDYDMSGNGTTLKEQLLASVVDSLHDLYTLKAHTADYKVSLTTEEEAKIKEVAQAFLAANTAEALEEMGATEAYVIDMLKLYTIQAKMYYAIIEDTDRVVSDEDANMRGFSYIEIPLDGKYDDNGKFVEFTAEEVLKIESTAKKMETELADSTLEDIAKKYDYKVSEGNYATKETSTILGEKTLYTKLQKLKEGETSEMLEFDDVIYFIRIDADTDKEATEDNREAIIKERETELFNDKLTAWQKEDGWVSYDKVIAKIEFHHIFTQDDGSTETESGSEKGTEKNTETGSEKTTEK